MFSLIFGFYNQFFSKPDVHVLIVGLDHAGKSTLLEHIKQNYSKTPGLPPEKITPTIGMNLAKFKHRGSQVILWDLGGQLKMRAVWERYYSEAHAVVFVLDSADPARLQEACAAYSNVCSNQLLQGVPIIILANKQDRDASSASGVMSLQEVAAAFNAAAPAGTRSPDRLFGVSGLTGQGVPQALETIVSEAKWQVQKVQSEMADV